MAINTNENKPEMAKEIELGDNIKETNKNATNGTNGTNGISTNGEIGGTHNVYGTPGGESVDGDIELETQNVSKHDSDDVIYHDDDEKEMEYVTPGGPDGDTPQ